MTKAARSRAVLIAGVAFALALVSCGEPAARLAEQAASSPKRRDEQAFKTALKEILNRPGPNTMAHVERLCRGEPPSLVPDRVEQEFPWSKQTIEHGIELVEAYSKSQIGPEVVGGDPTRGYPQCVAVGCDGNWGCSGTLIASNAVITAAHCCDQLVACGGKLYIKPCSSVDEGVRKYEAFPPVYPPEQQGVSCPERERKTHPHDIAVLILKEDVRGIDPILLSCSDPIDSARSVLVVGFGLNDRGIPGVKTVAAVPVESSNCGRPDDPKDFGCYVGEIVAKDTPDRIRRRDTCKGDSGGPAIIGGRLAGVTSRAVKNANRCGDGGVYVRIDRNLNWLRSIREIHWPAPQDDCQGQRPDPS